MPLVRQCRAWCRQRLGRSGDAFASRGLRTLKCLLRGLSHSGVGEYAVLLAERHRLRVSSASWMVLLVLSIRPLLCWCAVSQLSLPAPVRLFSAHSCGGEPRERSPNMEPLCNIAEYSMNSPISGFIEHTDFLADWQGHHQLVYARPLVCPHQRVTGLPCLAAVTALLLVCTSLYGLSIRALDPT